MVQGERSDEQKSDVETTQHARETSSASSMEDCSSKRRVLPGGGGADGGSPRPAGNECERPGAERHEQEQEDACTGEQSKEEGEKHGVRARSGAHNSQQGAQRGDDGDGADDGDAVSAGGGARAVTAGGVGAAPGAAVRTRSLTISGAFSKIQRMLRGPLPQPPGRR
jgi:hypothetical protein